MVRARPMQTDATFVPYFALMIKGQATKPNTKLGRPYFGLGGLFAPPVKEDDQKSF